ncbi:MAG TPA: hypothetical protein VHN14_28300, partial [Kofleriaceae bacterium]|nr:hypothetical protein [Kofleriaceae bacterium]
SVSKGACTSGAGSHAGFDASEAPADKESFDSFVRDVEPVLERRCAGSSCHGSKIADLYLTCGKTEAEHRWNYFAAVSHVDATAALSEILRRPLSKLRGGTFHEGGTVFASTSDKDYTAIRDWAAKIGKLDFANGDPGKQFFAENIQPLLLQRGCSFQACHSPAATNDFKLRSGTQGFFSAVALEKNYELLKNDFMALEFPDARRGRAVAKTLLSSGPAGIAHRGGPVLETAGSVADPADPGCTTFDPATSSAFCAFQAWINLERAALITANQVTAMKNGDPVKVVYVERATRNADTDRLSFDTFRGGAELRVATATLDATQRLTPVSPAASVVISGGCGLGASPDIQAPDVANDGNRVVFAARATMNDPLGIYAVNLDGSNCTPVTPPQADRNGQKIHNFDPAFSPDGKWIVFASTRGKPDVGPTKSRKRFLPQSDLWRVAMSGLVADQSSYEQITFLSNSEVGPHFMREGRITMTTEKASDGFYQLSGRRINWDRTDYHPLLAQRATSPYGDLTDLTQTKPSIGYASATDIREGSDGNFLLILSDENPATGAPVSPGSAGALGIFNRSIGPFEQGRSDTGYLPALRLVNGGTATGRAGSAAGYRAPVALPDGRIMVSYASNVGAGNFDIVMVDPRSGAQDPLFTTGPAGARVDAVLAYQYPARQLYENRRQLVFGGNDGGDPGHGVLHMPDAPMLFTLLTGNLRRGRPVDAFRQAKFLAVYSEGMCPATGTCSPGGNGIYQSRQMLGSSDLAADGSVRVKLPAGVGVVFELQDGDHKPIVTMGEEHQLGPGEQISMGVSESLFNAVCAGCHGSISGHEIDVGVTADALTGASASRSATSDPVSIGQ